MILLCIERHPRGWGTGPNFHDAAQLGFEGVGQETFCSPSFSPSLRLFLSFPFPFGYHQEKWEESAQALFHVMSTNPALTGSRPKEAGELQQLTGFINPPGIEGNSSRFSSNTKWPLLYSLTTSACLILSLSFCSTVAGANQMSACVLQCKLSHKDKEKTIWGKKKRKKKGGDRLTFQSSLKGCLVQQFFLST